MPKASLVCHRPSTRRLPSVILFEVWFAADFNLCRPRHPFPYALTPTFWNGSRHKARAIKRVSTLYCARFVMHRSNRSFERTHTGGADLRVFLGCGTPVCAAQFRR